jgi:hypothetical protein
MRDISLLIDTVHILEQVMAAAGYSGMRLQTFCTLQIFSPMCTLDNAT